MVSDNRPGGVLLVAEQGALHDSLAKLCSMQLAFRFVDGPRRDGLAAWWGVPPSPAYYCADVVEDARPLDGGFSQQALNRLLAQVMVEQRPAAVLVAGIFGCTLDLARLATLMGVPVLWVLDESSMQRMQAASASTQPWLASALTAAHGWLWSAAGNPPDFSLLDVLPQISPDQLSDQLASLAALGTLDSGFDYSRYEFCMRDHPLLMHMQQGLTSHFEGCRRVLDLGCGAGVFLAALQQAGIPALGVERNPTIAHYGREMGLEVVTADAIEYIEQTQERFDGIYCSHFIEHLPFELMQALVRAMAARLQPGGVLLLVFPDPESIRMQLQWFWRDPEHVRFYHVELVKAVATSYNLTCEWSNFDPLSHEVGGFPENPPPLAEPPTATAFPAWPRSHLWERVLGRLGLVTHRRYLELFSRIDRLERQQALLADLHGRGIEQLRERTERLWEVNRSWSWDDSVVMRLRKRS